jgi:hypothetical protein
MKVISLGIGGVLADRAGVEAVYYLGGSLLICSGLVGLVALHDTRLAHGSTAQS